MIKNLLFIFFLLIHYFQCTATIHVVSNQAGAKRDFRSIQSAIEYASSYDTIFVMGSPTNYGNVLLEKPLVLIGEGFSGEIYSGHTAKLTRVVFTSNPYRRTISSGSSIIGFEFPYFPGQRPNIITVASEKGRIENITLERNWLWFVEVVGNAGNWIFKNNVIRGWVNGGSRAGDTLSGAADFAFYNNILNSIIGFTRGNLKVENNLIMGRLKDISGAGVKNNIFTRDEFILEGVAGSDFRNNLAVGNKIGHENCYEVTSDFQAPFTCEGKANTGSENQVGVDPGFVYWPNDDIMGGTVFKLAVSSLAREAGTGGGEAGIYGGVYPFPSNAFLNPEIEDPFPSFVTSIY